MGEVKSLKELYKAAEPLMEYLNGLCNPHIKAIVDSDSVEVFEGIAFTFKQKKVKKK